MIINGITFLQHQVGWVTGFANNTGKEQRQEKSLLR